MYSAASFFPIVPVPGQVRRRPAIALADTSALAALAEAPAMPSSTQPWAMATQVMPVTHVALGPCATCHWATGDGRRFDCHRQGLEMRTLGRGCEHWEREPGAEG